MSTTVDERVVEMQFNNKNFVDNVQDSIKHLNLLKKNLNFEGATKGFDDLDAASRKLDFSGIGNALEGVSGKFSAWEAIAFGALTRIGQKAFDVGERLVKSLSVDQITAGWAKYEDKTTAVQTIMSATAQTWEKSAISEQFNEYLTQSGKYAEESEEKLKSFRDAYVAVSQGTMTAKEAAKEYKISLKELDDVMADAEQGFEFTGEQMDYVSAKLDKLNWFSDETSYSFTDMTSNIGKFTSAGVGLEDATKAMMGISTWAAKSGQNTQSASRAMYNLSQALSVGSVKLMDWRSIENANMSTQEFKQTAIQTAEALGSLKKVSDGVWKTWKGNEVTVQDFNSYLQDGWFNADVLMKTLEKYGGTAMRMSEIMDDQRFSTISTTSTLISYVDAWKKIGDAEDAEAQRSKLLEKAYKETGVAIGDLRPVLEELSGEEHALGLASFKAAQEAKTFTEAIDATKDAVSTGWMNTFDLIFGNYEEAKEFWTDVANSLWDVFAASGETRNAILTIWKEDGGRDNFIQGFWDLWEAISNLVAPIKEAFGEIFPSSVMSAARSLKVFTQLFKNFARNFKEMTAESEDGNSVYQKLLKTFKGLFSAVDILKQVITAVLRPLKAFFDGFSKGGSTITGYVANVASLVTEFDEMLKSSKKLEKFSDKVSSIFRVIGEAVANVIEHIGSFGLDSSTILAVPFELLIGGLAGLADSIGKVVQKLTGKDISSIIEPVITKLRQLANAVDDFFYNIKNYDFSGIIENIKGFFENLKKVEDEGPKFDSSKWNPLLSLFNGLKSIFGALWELLKQCAPAIGALVSGIGNALSNFGGRLKEDLQNGDFQSILDLANGGLLLGIGAGLKKFIDKLNKLSSGDDVSFLDSIKETLENTLGSLKDALVDFQNNVKTKMIKDIAIAVGILTASLLVLSLIDSDKLAVALGAMGAAMYEIFTLFKSISSIKSNPKTAASLIAMSVAVGILAVSMKVLSTMNWDEMLRGGVAMAGIMGLLVGAATIMSAAKVKIKKGTEGMIMMAIAMAILTPVLKALGNMEWEQIGKGLVTLGGSLLILVTSLNMMKGTLGGSAALLIAATALNLLIVPLLIFSKMDLENIEHALFMLGGALLELALGLNLMTAAIPGALALTIAAVGLLALAPALLIFGNMDLDKIGKALLALGGTLLVLALGLTAMIIALPGALALTVAAIGLTIMLPALLAFEKLNGLKILGTMAATAAGLVLLGVAGLACLPVAPIILALAVALDLLGIGLIAVGVGLHIIITTLATFAATIDIVVGAFMIFIKMLIGLIPTIAKSIAKGILSILRTLADSAIEIIQIVVDLGSAIIDALTTLIPKIVEFVMTIIEALVEAAPRMYQAFLDLIVGFLEVIRDNIDRVVTVITDVVIAILDTLSENLPRMIQAGIDFIFNFIEGIGQGIEDNAERLRDTLISLLDHVINAMLKFLGLEGNFSSAKTFGAGRDMIIAMIEGLWSKFKTFKDKVTEFISGGIDKVKEKFSDWKENAKTMISRFIDGVKEKVSSFKSKISELINDGKKAITDKFDEWKEVGKNVIGGLINGIVEKKDELVAKIKSGITAAIDAVKELLGIKSPSRVFKQIGVFCDEGMIEGLESYSGKVEKSTANIGKMAVDVMTSAISRLSDSIENGVDDPTIRPVLDLTEFESGMNDLNRTLDGTNGLNVGVGYSGMMNAVAGYSYKSDLSSADIVATLINKIDETTEKSTQEIVSALGEMAVTGYINLSPNMQRFFTAMQEEAIKFTRRSHREPF